MDIIEAIKERRSIRAFRNDPIDKKIIEKILELALKSPSFQNSQPWEVIVVSGKKKDGLSQILYKMAEREAPKNPDLPLPVSFPEDISKRVDEHNLRRYRLLGIGAEEVQKKRELRLRNYLFFEAPVIIFLVQDKSLPLWSIFDMGLFSQTLMLASLNFGIYSCPQASVVYYPDEIRKFLDIPENKRIVIGISLGYPDWDAIINQYRSFRVDLSEIVRWVD
ncbi:MAG: nitroreductase [Acidobacteriota bacterium]